MADTASEGGEETMNAIRKFIQKAQEKSRVNDVDWAKVKPELWDADIMKDEWNEDVAVTQAVKIIETLRQSQVTGERLLIDFQEDFFDWNEDMIKAIGMAWRREIKTFLRERGIYTGPNRARFTPQFFEVMRLEKCPEWPAEEIATTTFLPGVKPKQPSKTPARRTPSRQITAPERERARILHPDEKVETVETDNESQAGEGAVEPLRPREGPQQGLRDRQPPLPPLRQPQISPPPENNRPQRGRYPTVFDDGYRPQEEIPYRPQRERTGYGTFENVQGPQRGDHAGTPYFQRGTPFQPPFEYPVAPQYDPYKTLPPRRVPNQPLEPQRITQFSKAWDRKNKWTGKPYDLLDDKLRIFLNLCHYSGIEPDQFHAVLPRILTDRAERYYINYIGTRDDFATAYEKLKTHFETDTNRQLYYHDWTNTTFNSVRSDGENVGKHPRDMLQILLDKLQLCQRALGPSYAGDEILRMTVIRACEGVQEFEHALYMPAAPCEKLFQDLRSSLEMSIKRQPSGQYLQNTEETYYLDRRYNSNRSRGRGSRAGHLAYRRGFRGSFRGDRYRNSYRDRDQNSSRRRSFRKKCFVCGKEGCWSTKHTPGERQKAKTQYLTHNGDDDVTSDTDFAAFLADYEGCEDTQESGDEQSDDSSDEDAFVCDNEREVANYMMDTAFLHAISGGDEAVDDDNAPVPASQFTLDGRYSKLRFQGIIPDTGAAEFSTAGHDQYLALHREDPSVEMDTSRAGEALIRFGKGARSSSLGTVTIDLPIGTVTFHVINAPTPFLLCVQDMDKLGVFFRNTTDELVRVNQGEEIVVPVVRKWGHPWFFLSKSEARSAFFTETELRRLHRRFGHPSVDRLSRLLKNAGHNEDLSILETITKFCHHCQMNGPAPRRFKFTLKDDHDFNYELIIDVMYLLGKAALHAVDAATSFQAARFLSSLSAKDTWEMLRMMWMDTYLGPPDWIIHNAGTNFASSEFRNEAKIIGVACKQVPTEAHWSIGKVERYHGPLRRAFEILHAELAGTFSNEAILQIAVKAVNDTAGPDGLVPTLLVFGAFPRINYDSPPSPSTLRRAEAISKAMKALKRYTAERQVNEAIATRNGPETNEQLALPLQSDMRVWREKEGWQGPYKLIAVDSHDFTLDLPNGPVKFRSTLVRPYYHDDTTATASLGPPRTDQTVPQAPTTHTPTPITPHPSHDIIMPMNAPLGPARTEQKLPRKRGRPPGSKNKPKEKAPATPLATTLAPQAPVGPIPQLPYQAFLTQKEKDHYDLAVKLRRDGVITAPGDPFEESDNKEITDLIARDVFRFELFDQKIHGAHRLFKARMVREVKGQHEKPYEKSRLVIQGYNDSGKEAILTQSPTIQRASQRVITALAPSLLQIGMTVQLRDVTQAYVQSKTPLARTILAHLPKELAPKYPPNTIVRLVKPLYGIAEAGVHWWTTYHKHHRTELEMTTSTYDPCLLISTTGENCFGIVGMQTDDTLIVGTEAFSTREEERIQKAEIRCKPKTTLSLNKPLDFNGTKLITDGTIVDVKQKGQANKIELINTTVPDYAQQYLAQRARGAYLASICQPEAAFDLSVAAQIQNPEAKDCDLLNKRLKWQMEHSDRGLRYIPLDLAKANLTVFVDGSFANNRDLSSQIGFVIALVNEFQNDKTKYTLRGNVLHWSSTKCKRVTRSVLASEIYGMVNGFDLGTVISSTLKMITTQLGLPPIPLSICTDSYSLYECLVKLGTTKEKRLMVDIMSLRQSYEKREIHEIRWINGNDNPADAMTKASPNKALEKLIDSNELTIRVEGYVERG